MSQQVVQLAPCVTVYPLDLAHPPVLEQGWLLLPQLQAGPVFGDGSHPTTRLCATALDLLCRRRQPEAVLDVGTGTGVLARIARARGARFVVGTDIDSNALSCATLHARLDSHAVPIVLSAHAPDHWGARFDIVVANILEAPLSELAPALVSALAPGGVLLLSGFMRPQAPALRVRYEKLGLVPSGESMLESWMLLKLSQN